MDRPLVSFILLAYNQERYVADSLASALSQTYSPLELIISDDCSSDRTFEIARDLGSRYRGPHTVLLNRNERNLGITDHVNLLMRKVSGELILLAAADDISLPERTARTVSAWLAASRPVGSLFTNTYSIDGDGIRRFVTVPAGRSTAAKSAEEAILRTSTGISGCSHAFHPELFRVFGDLHGGGMVEDNAIGFRSLLLGGIHYVEEPLVEYRQHSSSVKKWKRSRLCQLETAYLQGWRDDLGSAERSRIISPARAAALRALLDRQLRLHQLEGDCHRKGLLRSLGWAVNPRDPASDPAARGTALYKAFAPKFVRRLRKVLTYDLFNPRDGFKGVAAKLRAGRAARQT